MEQLKTLIEGRAAQQFPIVLGEQATINAVTQRVERRTQNSGITDDGIAANAVGDAVGINTTGVWSTSSATLGIPFTHAYLRNIKHVNEGDFAYQELIPAYGNDVPTQYRWKDQGVWGAWKTSIEYRLADSALNTANAAKNSANAATATANTAQTAADAAKTAANNANAVAVGAQNKANTADANANSANAKAITAQNGVDAVTKVTKDIKLVDDYVSWENRASYIFRCVSGKGASINSNGNFHLFGAAGELTAAILGSSGDLVGSAWGASAGELGDLSAWLGARGLRAGNKNIQMIETSTVWGGYPPTGIVGNANVVPVQVGAWYPMITSSRFAQEGVGYTNMWQIGHFRDGGNNNGSFVIAQTGDGPLTDTLRFHFDINGMKIKGATTSDGSYDRLGGVSGTHWGGSLSGWVSRNFAPISDATKKRNVKPASESALTDIAKIDFVSYKWRTEDAVTKNMHPVRIGVTAQQLEEIDPAYSRNIETYGEGGVVQTSVKVIDTGNLLTLALKAINELAIKVEALEAKVN